MLRFGLSNLRAAWWAMHAARETRRALRDAGFEVALSSPPAPPRLPAGAVRGVRGMLHRTGQRVSCDRS